MDIFGQTFRLSEVTEKKLTHTSIFNTESIKPQNTVTNVYQTGLDRNLQEIQQLHLAQKHIISQGNFQTHISVRILSELFEQGMTELVYRCRWV